MSYEPGQYGQVLLPPDAALENLSGRKRKAFLENWHNRKWKPGRDVPIRFVFAAYSDDQSTRFTAGEVIVSFPEDISNKNIRRIAEKNADGLGA